MVLLHQLRHYPIESFLGEYGVSMRGVGGIEHAMKYGEGVVVHANRTNLDSGTG